MNRSYLKIKANDYKIYYNPKLLQADAIIINIFDASVIFKNFDEYQQLFADLKAKQTKIYLELDLFQWKKSLKAIDDLIGEYIDGFYLANPTISKLNKLSLKSRDYEVKHKLSFNSLEFIVAVNKTEGLNDLKKLFNSNRLKYILYEDIVGVDNNEYRSQVKQAVTNYHKNYIDPQKLTHEINSLEKINEQFQLNKAEVEYSLSIINNFNYGTKNDNKIMIKKGDIFYHYQVLRMAKRFGLIESYPELNFLIVKKKVKLLKKPIKIKKFYSVGEEIGNAISHGIGIVLAIVALILLMIKGGSTLQIISYLVFGLSALTLYTMSTLYHAFALGKKTKMFFQKLDHMTIYLLIAGTYTPFSLIAIGGDKGLYLCIFLWVGSLSGLLLNLFAFGKFRFLHMFLYVALGWVAILFLPDITLNLPSAGMTLLIVGGVMYTLGIFFYALRLFKFTHMIWHIFTIMGTVAHFLAILLYL